MCVGGGADKSRNVKKLSYAAPWNGLRAKPEAGKLGKSPVGERRRRAGEEEVCVTACSGTLSRLPRVK